MLISTFPAVFPGKLRDFICTRAAVICRGLEVEAPPEGTQNHSVDAVKFH